VTKDGVPVIFHDNHILTADGLDCKISDLTLTEFQAIGPSQTPGKMGRQLIRRRRDGSTYTWRAEEEDAMPTLVDLFDRVDPSIGFNVEVKFAADDSKDAGGAAEIDRILSALLPVVDSHCGSRPLFFSSFMPDAVVELKKRQSKHQVLFLTVGCGSFSDERMNSVQAAVAHCNARFSCSSPSHPPTHVLRIIPPTTIVLHPTTLCSSSSHHPVLLVIPPPCAPRHPTNTCVYNLCSEQWYDPSYFGRRVERFPFDDHGVPALELVRALCESAQDWLDRCHDNIIVVHCKVRWPVTFQPALATPPHVSKLLALLLPAHQPQPRRLQPQIDLQFLKPLGRPFLPGIGLPSSARQSHLALFSAESPPASDSSFSMHFSFHCAALHNILLTSLHTSFSWHFRVSYCAYLLPLLPHSPLPLHVLP
ncbi:unnamed protein product, partial [Closterium sp. Naga37s-1]